MKCFLFILSLSLLISCKKDEGKNYVAGVIVQKGGCGINTWLVAIENPDPNRQSFLCKNEPSPPIGYNCTNSVYIVNLPASLAIAGKKIGFSRWNELASCLSASAAPPHLEVFDITEK